MHGDKHGWARLIPLALGAALGIAGTWLATNTVSGDRTSEGSMPPKPPTAEQITQRASGPALAPMTFLKRFATRPAQFFPQ